MPTRSSRQTGSIDELWGAEPPRAAANALQYHVSQLRKALAPREAIVTQEPGYLIRVGPDELDLLRFERLVEEAQRRRPSLRRGVCAKLSTSGAGRRSPTSPHESFAQTEIPRLEELRLEALERRIEADLALGRYAELVGEVQALVREHPLRERLRAVLMQALYGSGRQVEALEVYRETRRLLVDELGIEPSPALHELEQAILRHDPALTSQEAPAAPPTASDHGRRNRPRARSTTSSRSPSRSPGGPRASSSWLGSCATTVSSRPRAPRSPNAETPRASKASRPA